MMSHSGAELTAVWDQLCSVKICVMYSSWFIMAGLSFLLVVLYIHDPLFKAF